MLKIRGTSNLFKGSQPMFWARRCCRHSLNILGWADRRKCSGRHSRLQKQLETFAVCQFETRDTMLKKQRFFSGEIKDTNAVVPYICRTTALSSIQLNGKNTFSVTPAINKGPSYHYTVIADTECLYTATITHVHTLCVRFSFDVWSE